MFADDETSAVADGDCGVRSEPDERLGGRGALIGSLLPDAACSEMFFDAPESAMFSAEAALVANAVAERRLEFGTVRHCARRAMRRIGVLGGPILPDADGVPRWPSGVVGSMTHCAGYRAAVVARADELRSIGVDAEVDAALPAAILDLILRDEERVELSVLAEDHPSRHWDRIVFSAKEAVFKAWFPLTRTWLEFLDVSVALRPDGTFSALVYASSAKGVRPVFEGRWAVDSGLIAAATSVRQSSVGVMGRALPSGGRFAREQLLEALG